MLFQSYPKGAVLSLGASPNAPSMKSAFSLDTEGLESTPEPPPIEGREAVQRFLRFLLLEHCFTQSDKDFYAICDSQEVPNSPLKFVAGDSLGEALNEQRDVLDYCAQQYPQIVANVTKYLDVKVEMSALAKRGTTSGWTPKVSRNNSRFLMSIDTEAMTETAYAVTLTLPAGEAPSPEQWQKMRKSLITNGLKYHGWSRVHWVTEFTRNLMPHLHMTVWVDPDIKGSMVKADILERWQDQASKQGYDVSDKAQDVKRVKDDGWFLYQLKHGSRGSEHYQRGQVPNSWKASTGRMWGYNGQWDGYRKEPERYESESAKEFWVMRRLIAQRNRALASAMTTKEENPGSYKRKARAIHYGRRGLKHPDPKYSAVRPMRLWATPEVHQRLYEAMRYARQPYAEPTDRQKRIKELSQKYLAATSL